METVTLTIDGRSITVEKGKTVLQASIEAGIKVPYYCYHPGLGIDASCRVCLVKIEKMPKLQTSCSTPVAEGMVVQTQDRESVEGRAGVFEFLLLNHPLDCPVCDKGGECPLQDFSYNFGPDQSRMEFERRVAADFSGVRLFVATPEDIVLAKLEWGAEGESERQILDAAGILHGMRQELDWAYLGEWVEKLGIDREWTKAKGIADSLPPIAGFPLS